MQLINKRTQANALYWYFTFRFVFVFFECFVSDCNRLKPSAFINYCNLVDGVGFFCVLCCVGFFSSVCCVCWASFFFVMVCGSWRLDTNKINFWRIILIKEIYFLDMMGIGSLQDRNNKEISFYMDI